MYGLLSYAYMVLGLYYRRVEDEANSLHVLKKAMKIAVDHDAQEYIAGILLNLSAVQLQMELTDEGSLILKKALRTP